MDLVSEVTRVPVPESADTDFGRFDYADAFEVRMDQPDGRTMAQWLRSGLEDSPAAMRALIVIVHRGVLLLRLKPSSVQDNVLGWRVTRQESDEARLEASGPLFRGRLVGRRVDAHTVRLDTFLNFNAPTAGRAIWMLVGPLHRRVAPYLLRRAASKASGGTANPVPDRCAE